MMKFKRRGEIDPRTMIFVFYLVLSLIILLALFGKVNGEARGDIFHQLYAKEDLSMALNLYDTGSLTLNYPKEREYNVAIKNGVIAVRKDAPVLGSYSEGNYKLQVHDEVGEVVIRKL